MKTKNSITKFSALGSVMKLKLFLLCHSLNAEKFEFYYTFQDTEFSNGIFSFHSISLQFSAPETPSVHPVLHAKDLVVLLALSTDGPRTLPERTQRIPPTDHVLRWTV